MLPTTEFKALSGLRRAYEEVDAQSISDPSIKKLVAATSTVVSDLLQTYDGAEADDMSSITTTTAPASSSDTALDRAVDDRPPMLLSMQLPV